MANTFDSARDHPTLLSILKKLVINQFCTEYGFAEQCVKVDDGELIKAGWLASILANSLDEKHQFIAATYAKLLYLQNSNNEQRTQLSYTILSRTGNLAATRHLETIYEQEDPENSKKFKNSFGYALDFEIGTKRNLNRIEIDNSSFFVTDFQRKLWDNLQIHDRVAISAPTSAGKSFFIQHFISSLFENFEEYRVIYIVPTRALISQVSDTFKQMLKEDVTVRTAFVDEAEMSEKVVEEKVKSKKEIFCVTPERCLKLLQQGWKDEFSPNLIFIDEIQNVETNDNRAVLLEYILGEISKLWHEAKIIFAGPFISDGKKLYEKLLEITGEEISTYLPPVYQLRLSVQNVNNKSLKVVIHLIDKQTHEVEIEQDLKLNSTSSNKSMLAPVIRLFGKSDGNLIYAARADWCVSYAIEFIKEISKTQGKPTSFHPAINDLIELLKEEVHNNYYLIYCLKYRVGFHHGKLPDIVKNEIEYLFEKGHIQYLFCTSTLLQGVNLPAPRMFIISPKKESSDLSHFEFGNLIGRAGRIRDSLVGTVFCLEKDPINNSWSKAYYNSQYTKEVIPTTEKALHQDIGQIADALAREPKFLKHSGEEYTYNLIKQKYVQNPQTFNTYLIGKGLSDEKIQSITNLIQEQLKARTIPYDLIRLNPNIDPVLQNKLYELIKTEGIDKWVLIDEENGNKNYKKFMKRSDITDLPYNELNFYFQFEFLLDRLDKIFAIWKESSLRGIDMGVHKMAYYGVTWLDSLSFSQLIKRDLEYYKSEFEEAKSSEEKIKIINNRINKVIGINSLVVTYILVKYFKILTDILENIMTEEEKKKYKKTLSLPTMLELGTKKIEVMLMISFGIPRPIALKLSRFVPENYRENPNKWLESISEVKELPIKRFYIKYLSRRGYLPKLKLE